MFQSVDDVVAGLGRQSYICNKNVATVVYLGTRLQKPILVEGPAGVGKTELGKVLAGALGMESDPPPMLRRARRSQGTL